MNRASDLLLALLVFYALVSAVLPSSLSPGAYLFLHTTHVLFWICFHTFGLGLVEGHS